MDIHSERLRRSEVRSGNLTKFAIIELRKRQAGFWIAVRTCPTCVTFYRYTEI